VEEGESTLQRTAAKASVLQNSQNVEDTARGGARGTFVDMKRALRAELDEAAWEALYTTKSRPFDPPQKPLR